MTGEKLQLTTVGRRIVCSTGTMPQAIGRRYHELGAVFSAVRRLRAERIELVLHPDWRPQIKPRTDQPDPWERSPKLTDAELLETLKKGLSVSGTRVVSVHTNRDLGAFLAAGSAEERQLGKQLLERNLRLAQGLDARLAVVHAWDTRAADINPERTARILNTVAAEIDTPVLTVENIPVSATAWSQAELMYLFAEILRPEIGFTLDLSWSSLYDNLDELLPLLPRVKNVHVQGWLETRENSCKLRPRAGSLDFERAIDRLQTAGYRGQWTLELNRVRNLEGFRAACRRLQELVFSPS